ncbi:beta strand repeat-containing protein [Candidatus Nanohalococcus occultus]|uniref:MSCRAMM family adhesin clumping factor ClfA withN-terminal knob domain of R1 and R2 pyocin n=1 Tax=Candidatus Nanohalococcus occultus TaxID=2978047 RepID=A0ABY8CGE5_9ARCH|nr:MSCRAMM family adhesin clumping factor ClfA withN-terminal knob domain of R1 and R2 pyocin [Candidatus Nanohaloarchaeota archaeon SVXNc]
MKYKHGMRHLEGSKVLALVLLVAAVMILSVSTAAQIPPDRTPSTQCSGNEILQADGDCATDNTGTDDQNLGTSGNDITLENGGSVTAPYADDADLLDGEQLNDILNDKNTQVENTDWNTLTEPGMYGVSISSGLNSSLNQPSSAYSYGHLIVTEGSGNQGIMQMYVSHHTSDNGALWIRSGWSNGGWDSWQAFTTKSWVNSNDDVEDTQTLSETLSDGNSTGGTDIQMAGGNIYGGNSGDFVLYQDMDGNDNNRFVIQDPGGDVLLSADDSDALNLDAALNMNNYNINGIGGLQNCGANEFVNGNGNCEVDTDTDTTVADDQNLEQVLNQGNLADANSITVNSSLEFPNAKGSPASITSDYANNDLVIEGRDPELDFVLTDGGNYVFHEYTSSRNNVFEISSTGGGNGEIRIGQGGSSVPLDLNGNVIQNADWSGASDLNSAGDISSFDNANDLNGAGTINDFSAASDLDSAGDISSFDNANDLDSSGNIADFSSANDLDSGGSISDFSNANNLDSGGTVNSIENGDGSLAIGTTSSGRLWMAPREAGSGQFSQEFGFENSTDRWYFETDLDLNSNSLVNADWSTAGDLDSSGNINDFSSAADLNSGGSINDFSGAADLDGSGAINDFSSASDLNSAGDISSFDNANDLDGSGNIADFSAAGDLDGSGNLVSGSVSDNEISDNSVDNSEIQNGAGFTFGSATVNGVTTVDHGSNVNGLRLLNTVNDPDSPAPLLIATDDDGEDLAIEVRSDGDGTSVNTSQNFQSTPDTQFRLWSDGEMDVGNPSNAGRFVDIGGDVNFNGAADLNGNTLREVGGIVDSTGTSCGSNEFLNGNGNCETDTDTDDQTLEEVRTQGSTLSGSINFQSSGDIISVNDINVASMTSNNGDSPIDVNQGLTISGDGGGAGNVTLETGDLEMGGNRITNIGGLQNCGSNEFVNGNGNCEEDTDTDTDNQDLSEVLAQGNTAVYDINMNSRDINTGGTLNALSIYGGSTEIARFDGGGAVTIPNGNLNMNSSSVTSLDQLRFSSGIYLGNSNTVAGDTQDIAIGKNAQVDTSGQGDDGIVIGTGASVVEGVGSQAIGGSAEVHDNYGLAAGWGAKAGIDDGSTGTSTGALALGSSSNANGSSAIAVGSSSYAGADSIAVGSQASSDNGGMAIGQNAQGNAIGYYAEGVNGGMALGPLSYADESNTVELGSANTGGSFNAQVDLKLNGGNMEMNGGDIMATSGNVTVADSLSVEGNIWTNGADLAEMYSSPQELEKAELVAINTEKDDSVVRTDGRYQETVTGIVSSNPSQVMNQEESGYPIALEGKVPLKVTEENGEIQRGDRLVPSSKPGTAMKCEIIDPMENKDKELREIISHNENCRSTTIGNALENSKDKNKILVKLK